MSIGATESINYTSATDPAPVTTPLWAAVLIGCFLTTVIIISIFGNVLVCVAILTDRKLRKASNLFLISLAISDLVVSVLVMPFALVNDILQYWVFTPTFCDVWIAFDVLSATASILNLCAISLDRYIHMKNPFGYERWMNHRKCIGFICLIWIASSIISFPPILSGWHRHKPNEQPVTTTSAAIDHTAMCVLDLSLLYASISSSISFYIPCTVMVAIYIKMYRLARYHAKKITQTTSSQRFTESNKRPTENKALFTLGMIMGLFLLCWIPFFVLNLVGSVYPLPDKLFGAVTWFGYLNSTMNPIIYSKFNSDFRAAFKRILTCKRCRRASDPYGLRSKKSSSSQIGLKQFSSLERGSPISNGRNGVISSYEKSPSNNNQLSEHQWESKSLISNDQSNESNRNHDKGSITVDS
ncbi:dopamine receptor 1-like [Watersipora subatra]|uniref:dopamine receptor 1-like n=1 Tax=Watersipora subatra TaxID=2589382 RepID=UPI00355B65FF